MPMMEVNHANFYYELHGQGHPLVLISGYTGSHQLWLPILDALSQHFQVLIFDNRAVGQTQDNGRELSAELMADDVFALTQALNLEKPHLVGSSMGGTIAQCYATQYPDALGKLVLQATSPKWRAAVIQSIQSILKLRQQGANFDELFETTMPWVFGEAFLSNSGMMQMLKDMILNDPFPQSCEDQARQVRVLEKFDGRNNLSKIQSDTLIAAGREDILSLLAESNVMLGGIPKAKLEVFDCAHAISSEKPKEYSDCLIRFLK